MNPRTTDGPLPLDFSDRIRDLTRVFVGREWLLREVDDFTAQVQDRYLVITGEPGIGKSAVAARLTQVRDVHAFHLCQARRGGTLDPIEFSRSLSRQLVRNLPDFGRHVVEQKPVHIDVHIDVEQMQGGAIYGVYIDEFIVQTRSADEAFQYLVREPLKAWAAGRPPDGPVFLLVDALDEALRLDRHPNIVDLIDAARDLPDAARWVLTSRPGEHLGVLPGARIVILDDSADNMDDVRAYVDAVLGESQVAAALRSQGADTAALRDELVRRSGGNFLYLHYVLDGIRQDVAAERSVVAPEQLPVGLDGVYREFLDRVLARKPKDEWRQIYRPVLGVLAVAQDALNFDQLVALSDVGPQGVNDVVTELDQFLDVAPGEIKTDYRIYHTSFADFLTDRARNQAYWTNPKQHHRQIAAHYIRNYADCWTGCDQYGLRYLPTHQSEAGQTEALRKLLLDFNWLQAKLDATEVTALLADYELLPGDEALRLVGGAIRLSAHVLGRDKTALAGQLLGRLLTVEQPEVRAILEQAKHWKAVPWLRPLAPSLAPPGGPLVRTLTVVTEPNRGAHWAIAPDGRYAVAAHGDTLNLWNLDDEIQLPPLTLPTASIATAIMPREKTVAIYSYDHKLRLYDLETRKLIRTFTLRLGLARYQSLALTRDFRYAVFVVPEPKTLNSGGYAAIWDLEQEKVRHILRRPGGPAVRFTSGNHRSLTGIITVAVPLPDGRLVTALDDGMLITWDIQQGNILHIVPSRKGEIITHVRRISHPEPLPNLIGDPSELDKLSLQLTQLAVTPDGHWAAFGTHTGVVAAYDLEQGVLLWAVLGFPAEIVGGRARSISALVIDPGGQRLITGSSSHPLGNPNGFILIRDMADGTILRTIKAHDSSVEHLGLSSQGKRVVSVVGDELKLWDLNRPDPSTATSHAGSVSAVTITPNGRRAVSASYDRTLKVWDTQTGAELCTLSEHVSGVNSVAAISDRYVISASHDATLKIWDIESGRAIRTLQGHEADVKAVAVTPDGKHAVSASFDRTLKHWDLENGEIIQSQPFSIHWTTVVNVTPDGRYALSTPHELDGQVQIHALNHEDRPRQLKIHDRFVNAVVGLAGGMAASVSDDGTLKIWSIERGKVQRTLKGQPRGENALAITPDGQRAITTAWDGTLTVWDLREEVVITRFIAEGQLTSCAISADGTFVIAGEYSGRVHLLRLQASSPMRLAKD